MGVADRPRPGAGAGAVIDTRGTRTPAAAWMAILGAAAAVSGARVVLLHTDRVGPSSDALGVVYWSTVGLTGVAVLLLVGELLAVAGGSAAERRDAVHRLPAWLCLVAVVVVGAVVHGHRGPGGDEATLTLVLTVQLLMTATAVLPAAVRDAR